MVGTDEEIKREGQPVLGGELGALYITLMRARKMLDSGEEDFLRLGGLVVRLCDSIARLQLARQKIQLGDDALVKVRAELDEILVGLGLGSPNGKGGNGDDQREH